MELKYEHIHTIDALLHQINKCEGRHSQQVAFSTFHHSLTQVCWGCMMVRSNLLVKSRK